MINPWCALYIFPNGSMCHAGIEEGMPAAFVTDTSGESLQFDESNGDDAFRYICRCEGIPEAKASEILADSWNLTEAIEEIGGRVGACEVCPHNSSCYQYHPIEEEE